MTQRIANEVYIRYFDQIRDKKITLIINLYTDLTAYDNRTKYSSRIFQVNESEEHPGLRYE